MKINSSITIVKTWIYREGESVDTHNAVRLSILNVLSTRTPNMDQVLCASEMWCTDLNINETVCRSLGTFRISHHNIVLLATKQNVAALKGRIDITVYNVQRIGYYTAINQLTNCTFTNLQKHICEISEPPIWQSSRRDKMHTRYCWSGDRLDLA